MRTLGLLWIACLACSTVNSEPADGIDDSFVSGGKADGSVQDRSPEAIGVLRVANELTFEQLDIDVALDRRAAKGIVEHRDGPDGIPATSDDDPFDTLEELDAVPYVGKVAFAKLLAYAKAHGYVPQAPSSVETCSGEVHPGTAVCGNASWAFDRPLPNDYNIDAAVTFASDDVWTVGSTGSVMHFDGASWQVEQTPVCETLTALWGTSADDLWAVGEAGRILHRTAAGWSVIDAGTCESLTAVWGSPGGDVWIAGWHGLVLRGNAAGFTTVPLDPNVDLQSLWGFAQNDIWGVADGGIYHWDGAAWTQTTKGHWDLERIWGSDPQHLFVGGFAWDSNSAAVFTFSPATAATPTMTLLSGNRTTPITGTSASDVWIASEDNTWHFDGTTWNALWTGTYDDINAFAAAGPGDVWALGDAGARLHYDGTAWSEVSEPLHGNGGLWATSDSDVWVARYDGISHWDGATWTDVAGVSGFYNGIWASGPSDVWAVGLFDTVEHFDGTTWTKITPPTSKSWFSVGGSGPNDVWIGGNDGTLAHWNGTAWTTQSVGTAVHGVFARSPSDAWFATEEGLRHWNGTAMNTAGPVDVGLVYRVWSSAPNDIWAVGYGVSHYDGNEWTNVLPAPSTFGGSYQGVWGTSPSDVWIAGGGAFGGHTTIAHWDGAHWTSYVNAASAQIDGIMGAGDHVWAVAESGAIVHFVR